MVAIYICGWLRFCFSALRAFYGFWDYSAVDEVVFRLNGDFRSNSSYNLCRLLLFGMTKRGNGQFYVDNGWVLLPFDGIKWGKRRLWVTLWRGYPILLHWWLCGMYFFLRTYCIGDFVVRDTFADRCIGDPVVIGSCMFCVFKLLVGLSLSPMMRLRPAQNAGKMISGILMDFINDHGWSRDQALHELTTYLQPRPRVSKPAIPTDKGSFKGWPGKGGGKSQRFRQIQDEGQRQRQGQDNLGFRNLNQRRMGISMSSVPVRQMQFFWLSINPCLRTS